MAIFFRHGEKKWNNNRKPRKEEGYECDPPIIGEADILKSIKKLPPNVTGIVTSPFLRCRQTADIIAREKGIAKITTDADLREYLGNQKGKGIQLDPVTSHFLGNQPPVETFEEFELRVERLKTKEYLSFPGVVIVGHSLTFSKLILKLTGKEVDLRPADFFVYSPKFFAPTLNTSPKPEDLPLPDFAKLAISLP